MSSLKYRQQTMECLVTWFWGEGVELIRSNPKEMTWKLKQSTITVSYMGFHGGTDLEAYFIACDNRYCGTYLIEVESADNPIPFVKNYSRV